MLRLRRSCRQDGGGSVACQPSLERRDERGNVRTNNVGTNNAQITPPVSGSPQQGGKQLRHRSCRLEVLRAGRRIMAARALLSPGPQVGEANGAYITPSISGSLKRVSNRIAAVSGLLVATTGRQNGERNNDDITPAISEFPKRGGKHWLHKPTLWQKKGASPNPLHLGSTKGGGDQHNAGRLRLSRAGGLQRVLMDCTSVIMTHFIRHRVGSKG